MDTTMQSSVYDVLEGMLKEAAPVKKTSKASAPIPC